MNGPSRHLTWAELGCWNRLPRTFEGAAPGERIEAYPMAWRDTRATPLADTFEEIRAALGAAPVRVQSAYRTVRYNAAVGGVDASQHTQGRALDIVHSAILPRRLFEEIFRLYKSGDLAHLGGLGSYKGFVHIDVRPRVGTRLPVWHY